MSEARWPRRPVRPGDRSDRRVPGRWLMVLGALVVTAGCSTDPSPSVAPAGPAQRIEVTYSAGTVQGGVSRVPVVLGRQVQFVVRSDVGDEVHVHGYDRKVDVPANGVATVEFVADQPGVFEVELESRGAQLAQLEVR